MSSHICSSPSSPFSPRTEPAENIDQNAVTGARTAFTISGRDPDLAFILIKYGIKMAIMVIDA